MYWQRSMHAGVYAACVLGQQVLLLYGNAAAGCARVCSTVPYIRHCTAAHMLACWTKLCSCARAFVLLRQLDSLEAAVSRPFFAG